MALIIIFPILWDIIGLGFYWRIPLKQNLNIFNFRHSLHLTDSISVAPVCVAHVWPALGIQHHPATRVRLAWEKQTYWWSWGIKDTLHSLNYTISVNHKNSAFFCSKNSHLVAKFPCLNERKKCKTLLMSARRHVEKQFAYSVLYDW